ncbi:phosphatase PAP2 family protein [Kitasatospora sp. KL5]|uniref:phosphatase PAP2 family protein n=1 Tax=Kitasatospora sp. KL5 TaxID=3425125 RepID=UPI003D6F916D
MHPSALPAVHRPVARHALWALGGTLLFGLLLGLVASGWAPLARLDQHWVAALQGYARRHTAWTASMQTLSDITGTATMRVVLLGAAVWLWAIRARALAAWAAAQALLGWAAAVGLQAAVGRARPHFADAVSHAEGPAFPSGHATASALTCAALVALAWPLTGRAGRIWACGAAAVTVLAVGWSRIALGVHWPSDVLGGWLAAAALLGWVTVAVELWRPGALARDFRRVDRHTGPRVQRVLVRGTAPDSTEEDADEDGSGEEGAEEEADGSGNDPDRGSDVDGDGSPRADRADRTRTAPGPGAVDMPRVHHRHS